ncbi:MAG: sensor histidine kinase [Candidatus Latescibacterota bacterium]
MLKELKRYALVYSGFILALTLLVSIELLAYLNMASLVESDRGETRTYLSIRELDRLLLNLADLERGSYGFVITGDERYLEPYRRARGRIEARLSFLKSLAGEHYVQRKLMEEIEALTWERLSVIEQTIELRRTEGFQAAYEMVITNWGRKVMDAIRERIDEAQREEEQLLRERSEAKVADTEKALNTLLAGGILSLVLLVMVFLFLRKEIVRRAAVERELRKHRDHLEELVAERTKDIESFDYSVSHNLRAPLRSVDGFSQMLLEDYAGKLGEEGEGYLRRIRSSAQYMGQLIEDLLALSRITRKEMQFTKVDLSALARSTVGRLREDNPGRDVETAIQDHIVVQGDERLLQTAVKHLIENAWKYTTLTPGARIEFGMSVESGREIYFVSDNGIGLDMKYAEKIFLPFQRLHDDAIYPGTGIGLSIVKRIIQRHGGTIRVESEPGKGATFYFTLGEER